MAAQQEHARNETIPPPRIYCRFVDGDPEIDALVASVCELGGPSQTLTRRHLRPWGYPETRDRAEAALSTAKKRPRTRLHRWLKRLVYGWQYNAFRHYFDGHESVAVCWSGLRATRRMFMDAARDAGRATLFMERAPFPGRVTVDPCGVNQNSGLPRDPAFYNDWADTVPDASRESWRRLKTDLVARMPARGDVGQESGADPGLADPFVFCPLQVPDDVQITQFSGWCGSLDGFLDAVMEAATHLPPGWHLRIKEHPSARVALRARIEALANTHAAPVRIDNQTDTFQQVAAARSVVTLNSSVGLQAFFFDKPVFVLGEALFRIEGVATPVHSTADLSRRFAAIVTAGYDAAARSAFMAYLDRVYYPEVIRDDPTGLPRVVPRAFLSERG